MEYRNTGGLLQLIAFLIFPSIQYSSFPCSIEVSSDAGSAQ